MWNGNLNKMADVSEPPGNDPQSSVPPNSHKKFEVRNNSILLKMVFSTEDGSLRPSYTEIFSIILCILFYGS